MTPGYLLDENVDLSYCAQLLLHDPDLIVWAVGDPGAPKKGTSDPDILSWCEEYGFILVTNNRKSMPRHLTDHLAQGRHMPGIFILNPDMSMGDTIDELILISGASFSDEYSDRISYLPLS